MQDLPSGNNEFIKRITGIVLANISDEKFGVSELAREAGMSRSNLLRKISKLTNLSASQFIRQERLKKAMEMLRQTSLNVSEVSYQVGFSSTSYFIKCFREYYGYPPGEAGIRDPEESGAIRPGNSGRKRMIAIISATAVIIVLTAVLFIIFRPFSPGQKELEKSIAVLPFINDSSDSSNVYIINGLMEAILNDLQQIQGLRVVSRTSVEMYRNNPKTIAEIARELDVNYCVEGSGQKIGDQILMNIQLIEAPTDRHVWSEQYERKAEDIFDLQREVAKHIAETIQVFITPEEEERIDKVPTDNLQAYDHFLKGLDLFYQGTTEGLEESIVWFKKAIGQDDEFARAYADVALAYYMLDAIQAEKQYNEQINFYADKALLLDPKLTQSLIAKAVYYFNTAEYESALPYLEKAHQYNPNSALAINFLSDFYASYIPDTEKYLEYALKGIRLNIAANDSATASFIYLHVSNALLQTGFIYEAETYINKSLEYSQDNLFSELVKVYILFAQNRDLKQTEELLLDVLKRDTTRLDLVQEVGKVYYYMRDYENAYAYYQRLIDAREAFKLDLFTHEHDKIGVVFSKMGMTGESEKYLDDFMEYCKVDQSDYRYLNLAMLYSYRGETAKAIEQLELYAQQDHFDLWVTIFIEMDPLVDNIRGLPEFKKLMREIEVKFWKSHNEIKAALERENLI
jgi:TolB-like protein/AraC-like DNA-binding protein